MVNLTNNQLSNTRYSKVQSTEVLSQQVKLFRRVFLSFAILLFTLIGIIVLFPQSLLKNSREENTLRIKDRSDTTAIPFVEMTIPYLRQRKYESSLNERKLLAKHERYTSYLTSYISDGLRVNGLLTIPTSKQPKKGWPAIVFIHGYIPPSQYQTNGDSYSSYVDYLARNGFVVFKIDLRGHGNSEGEPKGGYYSSDYVIDALNARAALQSLSFVNPQAIGLWGHSMGGNIVLRSMAAQPDIPVSVIWAGAVYSYTDWEKYGIHDTSYSPPQMSPELRHRRQELFEKYGSPSAKSSFWQQVSPINYLSDLKGAIQIHHAIDDDVVNIGYSRDLVAILDTTAVPHELFEYEYGGHNISGASFVLAMERTVQFFNRYLKK